MDGACTSVEFLKKEEGFPVKCEDLKFEAAFLEKDIIW